MALEEPHHLAILTNYLVRPCPGSCANPKLCLFYHNLSERRRSPFNGTELAYNETMCPNVPLYKSCEDSCKYCHTFQELVYHPNKYKLTWCEQANCKGYNLCYHAHRSNEKLRTITHVTISQNPVKIFFFSHLDLTTFKTSPCTNTEPHNPKLCTFYHSNRDKVRKSEHFFEMCTDNDKDQCSENCEKSHNRVEQLYHPDKYKLKFCTFYPKKIHECDYGSFCSFAHSESDIKIELIHNYQRNEEFYMYSFKTVWCPFISQHDKAMCVYAHNWQDFRRKPKEHDYKSIPCPQWKPSNFILSYSEGGCEKMTGCFKCHGWKEIEFHPSSYKTKPCVQGKKCGKIQDCPFFHSSKDRRSGDMSPLKQVENHWTGVTPHPQKQFLSPDTFKSFQTPFVMKPPQGLFMTSSKVELVKSLNANTKEFVMHRSNAARNAEHVRNINANTDDFVLHRGVPIRGVHTGPIEEKKPVDARVTQFLSRHKIKHLSSLFLKVKWEDLPTLQLAGPAGKEFEEAWNEEKEDLDQFDELINTDIALFTGQKTGHTPDLKKFALQNDIDEIIVTFPKASFIPNTLKCPITKKLMHDPAVFSLDGRTYERFAITQHIETNYSPLEAKQLIKNLHCNKYIREEILSRFE